MCWERTLTPVNACRVCVVRGQGLPHARAVVRAQGRGRDGGPDPLRPREAQPQDGDRVPGLLGRPVRDAQRRALDRGVRRRPASATGRRRRRSRRASATASAPATTRRPTAGTRPPCTSRRRSTTSSTCATTPSASSVTSASRAAAPTGRTRSPSPSPGRGFDARIATEFANPLPDSACVYCGNCIAVCPTGALMFKSEFDLREEGNWDEERQTRTQTICTYCGVGCNLVLHEQDNAIVKVTSPLDHPVTSGNLCIKGRFGFQFVQNDRSGLPAPLRGTERPRRRPGGRLSHVRRRSDRPRREPRRRRGARPGRRRRRLALPAVRAR